MYSPLGEITSFKSSERCRKVTFPHLSTELKDGLSTGIGKVCTLPSHLSNQIIFSNFPNSWKITFSNFQTDWEYDIPIFLICWKFIFQHLSTNFKAGLSKGIGKFCTLLSHLSNQIIIVPTFQAVEKWNSQTFKHVENSRSNIFRKVL